MITDAFHSGYSDIYYGIGAASRRYDPNRFDENKKRMVPDTMSSKC